MNKKEYDELQLTKYEPITKAQLDAIDNLLDEFLGPKISDDGKKIIW